MEDKKELSNERGMPTNEKGEYVDHLGRTRAENEEIIEQAYGVNSNSIHSKGHRPIVEKKRKYIKKHTIYIENIQNEEPIEETYIQKIKKIQNDIDWVEKLLKNSNNINTPLELAPHYKNVNIALNNKEFSKINELFVFIDIKESTSIILVGLLRLTYLWRKDIEHYSEFLSDIDIELTKRGLDTQKTLTGLIEVKEPKGMPTNENGEFVDHLGRTRAENEEIAKELYGEEYLKRKTNFRMLEDRRIKLKKEYKENNIESALKEIELIEQEIENEYKDFVIQK